MAKQLLLTQIKTSFITLNIHYFNLYFDFNKPLNIRLQEIDFYKINIKIKT